MDYRAILKKYWGYDDFRGIQREIIESIGAGRDTLGLMPTGGGKSITFQVPALAQEGTCLVITPLIALMKDQVANLKKRGIRATAIYSGLNYQQLMTQLDNCVYSDMKFLYISPERVGTELMIAKLHQMNISFVTIDEAHCISQWGYDFRPAYLKLATLREILPKAPILALTATATEEVVEDIQLQLGFKERNVFRMSFKRDNVAYVVRNTSDKEKELIHILKSVAGCAIVYVRNRKGTRDICKILEENGFSATFYHAGLSNLDKDARQLAWTNGDVRIIVATNAFGMGIDKPDVRIVIHMNMPNSLEEYFQEAGRAGRDGLKSYAVLLYMPSDLSIVRKRVAETFPEKKYIRKVYDHICWYLQLAEGYGYNVTYDFNIEEFCTTHHFFPVPLVNALNVLEKAGYIEYDDSEENKSRIMFIVDKEDIYHIRVNRDCDKVMEALMRSYGTLFTDYAFIKEDSLAKTVGMTRRQVYDILKYLTQQRILHYIPPKKNPQITFTTSRVMGEKLNITKDAYENRKERFVKRLDAMIDYVSTNSTCRSKLLLRYFGETNAENCGMCDVCLNNTYGNRMNPSQQTVEQALHYVVGQLKTKRQLEFSELNASAFSKEMLGAAVRRLLAESKVIFVDGILKIDS